MTFLPEFLVLDLFRPSIAKILGTVLCIVIQRKNIFSSVILCKILIVAVFPNVAIFMRELIS